MENEQVACKVQCSDVLVQLCGALDSGANEEAAEHFVDNVILRTQDGRELAGEEVRDFIRSRPSNIVTRHVISNILVTPISKEAARASAYITVYRTEKDGEPPFSLPKQPQGLGDWIISFRKTPGGWKIERYEAVMVMAAKSQ